MTPTTDDPNDPRVRRGGPDSEPVPQNEAYLVLSDEELSRGFVRPLRESYVHSGMRPKGSTRELTEEERERYASSGYVLFEKYGPERSPVEGRFWTPEELNSGCGATTTMGLKIAETYARDPLFYGATYCSGCRKHRPVEEFTWPDGSKVGS